MDTLNCPHSLSLIRNTNSSDSEVNALILKALLWLWRREAFDYYAGGFEVGHLVVGAMSLEDGLAKEGYKGTGLVGEPPVGGLVPVDDQVVRHVAFGA